MDIRFSKTKKSQSERSYTDNNYFKMKYCKSCFPGDIISACFSKSSFCWQTLFCFEVFWSFFFQVVNMINKDNHCYIYAVSQIHLLIIITLIKQHYFHLGCVFNLSDSGVRLCCFQSFETIINLEADNCRILISLLVKNPWFLH